MKAPLHLAVSAWFTACYYLYAYPIFTIRFVTPMNAEDKILELTRVSGILRSRDLEAHGIARTHLQRLQTKDKLRKVGRGLYVLAEHEATMHSGLAAIAKHTEAAVVCLLSALRVHELTTQAPFEVWIAIPTGHRPPKSTGAPVRVVRMATEPLAAGVEQHQIDGVSVPVFDAEKTVVDCFRFRNRIGLDVALEAMRDYLKRPGRSVDQLLHYARIDRVANTIRPYLEAML